MNWRFDWRWAVAAFGAFALLDAVLLASSSPLIPERRLESMLPSLAVPVLALSVGAVGVWTLLTDDDGGVERPRPSNPREESPNRRTAGGKIDEAFETLAVDSGATDEERRNATRTLKGELRRSLWELLAARGYTDREIERLVRTGEWTDDDRAAAFLGEVRLPLRTRVRDWASGEGTRRRAEAAASEVAELAGLEVAS